MNESLPPTPPPSSPSSRQILASLRQEILDGGYPAESRLPTRRELAVRYNSNLVTVQRALEQLRRDGFVVPRGKLGTFVCKSLPHLTRFAIVFGPANPAETNSFFAALVHSVNRLPESSDGRTLTIFEGLEAPGGRVQMEQLITEVTSHRLSGVILIAHPNSFVNTPILDSNLPRVSILSEPYPKVPAIFPNYHTLFTRSLDYLQSRGRKRIAILTLARGFEVTLKPYIDQVIEGLPARGMMTEPFWNLPLPESATAVRNAVHLLMRPGQPSVPDGIIVSDDHLVRAATQGLMAAGIHTNEKVDVVAACNFPFPPANVIPVKRLGFDARQILGSCLDSLVRQRNGETVPDITPIEAVFEEELTA